MSEKDYGPDFGTYDPRAWTGRDGKRNPRGSNHRNAKLTEEQVREIKTAHLRYRLLGGRQAGVPPVNISGLARQYGVSVRSINGIVSGETWTHVRVTEEEL